MFVSGQSSVSRPASQRQSQNSLEITLFSSPGPPPRACCTASFTSYRSGRAAAHRCASHVSDVIACQLPQATLPLCLACADIPLPLLGGLMNDLPICAGAFKGYPPGVESASS